jgi:cytochrome c oxidase subunit 2
MRRLLPLLLFLGGCEGTQSALDAAGPQARQTLWLFQFFLVVSTAVWVLVVLALAIAIGRRRRRRGPAPASPLELDRRAERRTERIVTGLTALTAAIITVLTAASYLTGRGLASDEPEALSIRVTGHQWWWEVTYQDARPHRVLTTAK